MGTNPILTRGALAAMLAEAARAHPAEACGLLLGERIAGQAGGQERITAIAPTANVAADPTRHFEIDPAALIAALRAERRGEGLALLGWYHSHPSGDATPSAVDQASAPRDGRLWAIIAGGTVRVWRDAAGGFEALPTGLGDG
jgi:proteasome lid subunit RPN8/RPN11